jgi:sn-glycerol 3-phosphate transport system substrate-binding protein
VSIDFWHLETVANQAALDRLIDRFNASQDEVRVRLIFQGSSDDIILKLLTSLRGGEVPALVELADVDTQVMVDSGKVTPVQKFVDAEEYGLSDFDEKVVWYYTVDGDLYAMPFAIAVPMLFYNKAAFRDAGLDPEKPPLTLDDVRAYSEKLLKVDGAGNIVRSGLAMDIRAWYLDLTLAQSGDLYVNNNNGRDGRPTEAVFNGSTGRAFFRWWDEMIDEGLAFNVGRNPTGADTFMAIGAGRAAMTFSASPALRSVLDVLEAGGMEGVELGVGPFPSLVGGSNEPRVGSRSLWVLNSRPEEEQRAAWRVAQWLAEPEQQAELFAESGYLPVRLSAYGLEASRRVLEKYPSYQVPVDLFLGVPATPAKLGPRIGPFSKVHETVARAMEEVSAGGKDPVQALDDAAVRATQELQEYNRRVRE